MVSYISYGIIYIIWYHIIYSKSQFINRSVKFNLRPSTGTKVNDRNERAS